MSAIKDSSIYIMGEIIGKVLPFLALPYFTRKLGPDGFGQLAYIEVFIGFAVIFTGLSQDGAIARYFYRYGKRSIGLVLVSGWLYSCTLTLLIVITAAVLQSYFILLIALNSFFNTLLASQLSLRQCQRKAFEYISIQISSSVLSIFIAVILFETLNTNYLFKVAAYAVGTGSVAIIAFALYTKQSQAKILFTYAQYKLGLKYIFALGLPLIFHQLSFFCKIQLDRLVIYAQYSEVQLGLYAAAYSLSSVVLIAIMSVNKALVPYCYEALKRKTINFDTLTKYALISFLFVPLPSLILSAFPDSIFSWFLGEQFSGIKNFCLIFLCGIMLSVPYLFFVNYLFYHGKTGAIAMATSSSIIVYSISLYSLSLIGIGYMPFAMVIVNAYVSVILFFIAKNHHKQLAYSI